LFIGIAFYSSNINGEVTRTCK